MRGRVGACAPGADDPGATAPRRPARSPGLSRDGSRSLDGRSGASRTGVRSGCGWVAWSVGLSLVGPRSEKGVAHRRTCPDHAPPAMGLFTPLRPGFDAGVGSGTAARPLPGFPRGRQSLRVSQQHRSSISATPAAWNRGFPSSVRMARVSMENRSSKRRSIVVAATDQGGPATRDWS